VQRERHGHRRPKLRRVEGGQVHGVARQLRKLTRTT
jgi:hypothetical protein